MYGAEKMGREELRSYLGNFKIPVLELNVNDSSISWLNDNAISFYGYSSDKITGMKVEEIIHNLPIDYLSSNVFTSKHRTMSGEEKNVKVHQNLVKFEDSTEIIEYQYWILVDISDCINKQNELDELNRDFITLLENTTDFIYFKDQDSRFRFCSQTLAKITNHNHWTEMKGKHDFEVFPMDTAKIYNEEETPVFDEGNPLLGKIDPFYNENGESGWVHTNKWPVFDESNKDVVGIFGISRDITELREAEQQRLILASVFESATVGIIVVNDSIDIIEANLAYCEMVSCPKEEILGSKPNKFQSGHHSDSFYHDLWKLLSCRGYWEGVLWNRRKCGELFACQTTITAVLDDFGTPIRYIGVYTDITEKLEELEKVKQLAYSDTLTQLPNRELFYSHLAQSMEVSNKNGTRLAIGFMDLDGFKSINDTYGHHIGDKLLAEVASRLRESTRSNDMVARWGGDEFSLLFCGVNTKEKLDTLINKILALISNIYELDDQISVQVTASIGISIYPDKPATPRELLQQADSAMYEAKQKGKNCWVLYS